MTRENLNFWRIFSSEINLRFFAKPDSRILRLRVWFSVTRKRQTVVHPTSIASGIKLSSPVLGLLLLSLDALFSSMSANAKPIIQPTTLRNICAWLPYSIVFALPLHIHLGVAVNRSSRHSETWIIEILISLYHNIMHLWIFDLLVFMIELGIKKHVALFFKGRKTTIASLLYEEFSIKKNNIRRRYVTFFNFREFLIDNSNITVKKKRHEHGWKSKALTCILDISEISIIDRINNGPRIVDQTLIIAYYIYLLNRKWMNSSSISPQTVIRGETTLLQPRHKHIIRFFFVFKVNWLVIFILIWSKAKKHNFLINRLDVTKRWREVLCWVSGACNQNAPTSNTCHKWKVCCLSHRETSLLNVNDWLGR